MELINLLEIKTDRGYRHFKLYHGDITKLDFRVDRNRPTNPNHARDA